MAFLIIYIDFFGFLMVVVHIYRNLQKMHFFAKIKFQNSDRVWFNLSMRIAIGNGLIINIVWSFRLSFWLPFLGEERPIYIWMFPFWSHYIAWPRANLIDFHSPWIVIAGICKHLFHLRGICSYQCALTQASSYCSCFFPRDSTFGDGVKIALLNYALEAWWWTSWVQGALTTAGYEPKPLHFQLCLAVEEPQLKS